MVYHGCVIKLNRRRLKVRKLFPFVITISIVTALQISYADSQIRPGYRCVEGEAISPSEANAYFSNLNDKTIESSALLSLSGVNEIDEISELAKGLKHDPDLIYQFVRNHIEYTPTLPEFV